MRKGPAPEMTDWFDSTPLVTAVVVCFNHARFVVDALESVAAQTYPSVQVVIVDDASQDDSQELIRDWLRHHRVDWHFLAHTRNVGAARSLNEALSHAHGDYIAPLATDDRWLPHKVSTQVRQLESLSPEVGVAYSDVYVVDELGRRQGRFIERYRAELDRDEQRLFDELLLGNFIPAPGCLIRASVFRTVGVMDERLAYEDWDFWLRAADRFKFAYTPTETAEYRLVPGSLGHRIANTWETHLDIYRKWARRLPDNARVRRLRRDAARDVLYSGRAHHVRHAWMWFRYGGGVPALRAVAKTLLVRHP